MAELVFGAFEETGLEEVGDVASRDRAVSDAALFGLNFNQWLKVQHAARAVADDFDVLFLRLSFGGDGGCHLVGTNRERCCVARNVDGDHRAVSFARDATISSKRFGVTLPYNLSPIMIAGERAQLPRQ